MALKELQTCVLPQTFKKTVRSNKNVKAFQTRRLSEIVAV